MTTPSSTESLNISSANYSKVDKILERFEYKKSNLIAILQEVQAHFKFLPENIMTYLGTKMGVSPATVFGVATFYSQFSLEPKGKYIVKICDGTACHVRGSKPVYDAVMNRLKLTDGKFTTDDGLFSVETVSCLGACGLAPVCVINEKIYPKMTPDAILAIINNFVKDEGV